MPIRVDEDGDTTIDRDDDDSTLGIPALIDESGDGKDDVDLRTDGSSAEVNGALVATGSVNSGTGNFNDFLGVQNNGTEFGFNTDTPDPSNPHIKTSSNFTKTIKLSEVGIVTIDGVDYYQFLLDVNENNANPTEQQISLDSFKLYTSLDGTISTLTDLEAQHLAFDIDNADPGNAATENDISILFTDAYSSGSGRSDLSILVPVDAIEAQGDGPADTYIYLYTEFGYAGEGYRTSSTFEEWRTVDAVTLQGTKFNDLNQDGIRQEAGADGILGNADDEVGLEGWTIFIDSNGNGVLDGDERSTVTDANGNYFFYGIQSDATYTIDEDLSERPDWLQTTGDNETVTVPRNAETGSNIIVDPIGNYQLMPSIHLVKEVPEILGGSGLNGLAGADSPGDKIVYLFTVTNNGDLALTDVDLTDPNIDGGSLVRLDDIFGNNDNVLDVGEKWAFTATHTVTQDELDSNGDDSSDGPDGDIDNTATVTAQSAGGEVSANDDEDAPLLQIPGIEVLKSVDSIEDDEDFNGTDQVDSAGDVINYNITISNTGNFALSGVTMTDKVEAYASVNASPVEDGFGFNIGDTDADGYLDVDEVWEYTASYTVTQADIDNGGGGDGAIDNVATGDTNETLPDQDDASVPIVDAPAINIVKEGVSEDPDCTDAGDTITYTYTVTNTGNVALSGVVVVDDQLGTLTLQSGDTDNDGNLDVDETWIYTDSYMVTQADVDGWGGGDGTIDNVVTANGNSLATGTAALEAQDAESIALCDEPAINIVKEGVSDDPDCTDAGDTITYTYTVTNTGNVALTGVVVVDDQLGTLTLQSGDTDNDGNLDVDETWIYTDSYMVTQADVDGWGGGDGTIDNVVTANGNSLATGTAALEAQDEESIALCDEPAINIVKEGVSDDPDCTDAGDTITYTYTVTNTGNVALTGVVVVDDQLGTLTLQSGDNDNDGNLDVDETWIYTDSYMVTQADVDANAPIVNVVTADANSLATGSAALQATDTESIDVCYEPSIDVEKYISINDNVFDPLLDDHDSPTGPQATSANNPIYFLVTVTNDGNATLTGLDFSDILSSPAGSVFAGELDYTDPAIDAWVDLNGDGFRDAGEDWAAVDGADGSIDGVLDSEALAPEESLNVYYTMPFEAGQHINTVTVSTDQGVSDSDAAHYFGLNDPAPGVRTPGFWQNPNNGGTFWDGIADNQAHDGPDFPDGDPGTEGNQDLLYAVDSNNEDGIDGNDQPGLLIGDYNRNGLTDNDPGADGIFGTADDYVEDTLFISLADAQELVDASSKKGNDVVSKLGRDVVATWLNFLSGNDIGDGSENTAKHYLDDAIDWLQSYAGADKGGLDETFDSFAGGVRIKTSSSEWKNPDGLDHSGGEIHNALAEYNEGGTVNGVFVAGDADSLAFQNALADALSEGLFEQTSSTTFRSELENTVYETSLNAGIIGDGALDITDTQYIAIA